jgi:molybdate transport system substrate-binding protein
MRKLLLVLTVAALALAGCSGDDDDSTTASHPTGDITVFAASSLSEGFTQLGKDFEAEFLGTKVTFSFGSSSELVTQIQNGAPADAFASADEANMKKLTDAKLTATAPATFAHNRLAIAVAPGNPKNVTGLSDLARSNLNVVLCAAEVPCGKYADEALANAGVTVAVKSREPSVKATLAKVELGEADAAIVYVTDVKASGKIDGADIPDAQNVVATLPIAALKDAGNADLAGEWVAYVTQPASEKKLQHDFGFLAP